MDVPRPAERAMRGQDSGALPVCFPMLPGIPGGGTIAALSRAGGWLDAQVADPLGEAAVTPGSMVAPAAHHQQERKVIMGTPMSRWRIALDTKLLDAAAANNFVGGMEKVAPQSTMMQ